MLLVRIPRAVALSLPFLASAGVASALDPARATTQYVQRIWQIEDGLPQNTVWAVRQTRDGYIWLATQEGLVRFDGVHFTVFDGDNTPSMRSNRLTSLHVGHDGSLWVATYGGLLRLKDGRFETQPQVGPDETVHALAEDAGGTLWVGTASGLRRRREGLMEAYDPEGRIGRRLVTALMAARDASLWIGTEGGLYRLTGDHIPARIQEGLASSRVKALHEGRDGSVWVGTTAGLYRLKDGGQTHYTMRDGLGSNHIRSVYEDTEGNLWIGTEDAGLDRYTDGRFSAFTLRDGLTSDMVTTFFEDREGGLWVGTNGGGVDRFADGLFTTYSVQEGLPAEPVGALCQTRDGALWIGTMGGLSRLRDGRVTDYFDAQGAPLRGVRGLYEAHDDSLWIGTVSGLRRLKDGVLTVYSRGGIPDDVRAFHEEPGGMLWMGTSGTGLLQWRDGRLVVYAAQDRLGSDDALALREGADGSLWIGTQRGLVRLREGVSTLYGTAQGLSSPHVSWIHRDDEGGALWIGTTGGGLNRFKDGRFTVYNTRVGLFDNVVHTILDDGQGSLWMSSNKGVFSVSKSELHDFAEGRITRIHSASYGRADGMKSAECNGNSQAKALRASDGRLWFATIKGAVVVDPKSPRTLPRPATTIEEVLVNRRPLPLGPGLQAEAGDGDLEIRFTAPSFRSPETIRFRYRLEGFDRDWIDAGTRRAAYYTNIPPGRYRFVVAAAQRGAEGDEAEAGFDLYMVPRPHQTVWFLSLCVGAVVGLVLGGHRMRVRHLKARERELTARVDEAMANVRTLRGLLPMCAWCKKIRDDTGYWSAIEAYVSEHTHASFTHGICPDCRAGVEASRPR